MNVHDGVVGTGVSQHSHEIFPQHGVGQTIGVDRLQLRITDLILKARDIVDVPTELTERRSGGGSSEAERVMPRWFVESDTERWKPLVVMALHIVGRFLRQIGVSGCEMLVSDACRDTEKEEVMISVSDNGIGISSDEQQRVWTKFYRSNAYPDMMQPGIGLGLSFVDMIVKAHGGRKMMQSEVGKGTRISIVIPQHF